MGYLIPATDHPFGAIPYDGVLSVNPYNKDSAAVAIYPGDFVIMETDGGIGVAVTGSTNIIGVAAEYSAASTAKTDFLVYDHTEQKFAIQDDSTVTGMTEASVGTNANIVTTTGNTTTLRSQVEIDSDTAANTAALALKILHLHPVENRSFATTTNQQRTWVVKINNHFHSAYQQLGV